MLMESTEYLTITSRLALRKALLLPQNLILNYAFFTLEKVSSKDQSYYCYNRVKKKMNLGFSLSWEYDFRRLKFSKHYNLTHKIFA